MDKQILCNYGCDKLAAVISGGTSGIGLAVAEKLLADGATVFLLGRGEERGAEALDFLRQRNESADAKVHYIQCNVAQSEACREAVKKVASVLGRDAHIDILVNSAGVYMEQRLENMQEEDYTRIMDVNVKGTMLLTQAALPYMYSGGSIVNIASDAAVSGNYGCPLYCASKGAVVALTRALALDLAPAVRVNCVCPADVDTPLLAKQLRDAEGSYSAQDVASAYPLQRVARAEEVAHVVCSVASPHNGFMTGSIISVDGGLNA